MIDHNFLYHVVYVLKLKLVQVYLLKFTPQKEGHLRLSYVQKSYQIEHLNAKPRTSMPLHVDHYVDTGNELYTNRTIKQLNDMPIINALYSKIIIETYEGMDTFGNSHVSNIKTCRLNMNSSHIEPDESND
ncbi:hypothetical protein PHYBLDRAFT_64665 [Phycomyces blakesleeanus NRRL 1555(-)]|uniref:Uncharacterized protein n=1 Tax=Phycomyces blakesleeanus (strain ATCC 8743b / DSM 1359 / FGSC 10004 / NBRC 33097 / NRRL 1555) TaxID=763407 RepID=A0A162NEU8_PHYB8|nr:hypothetical protein PHYBLDRAFT_64665 [Phycomyces blakesleeanus NRRL 1555(-)]OAD73708.1 hypothetical protein PHYBLDRAFT_64665 [Phycomyces blakesleeanus NRRL 1555(-)]|eukprot:XP_018291748.1 hypothetical protein PHYBLDRAFT_64665 [Phycomyces blakesleeanus NRRL 1555(-)]